MAVKLVINSNQPHLWHALQEVARDQGCPYVESETCDMCKALRQGCWETDQFTPTEIAAAEVALAGLTEEERGSLAAGEMEVVMELERRSPELALASRILGVFFDGE